MAYLDSKTGQIIHVQPKPCINYPEWVEVDCGCCNGIRWGGEYPRECETCYGNGVYFRHRSGALALHPGGTFIGREAAEAAGGE